MSAEKLLYYEFGEYRADVANGQLLKSGKTVVLTQKSFDILLFLIRNRGRIVKKNELFDLFWADTFVEEATLTQHIYMLRKAFKENGESRIRIETIPKLGYRFAAEVGEVFAQSSDERDSIGPEGPDDGRPQPAVEKRPSPKFQNAVALGAFVSLIILSISVFFYLVSGKDRALKINSIAVMPFHQIHSEKDDKMGLGMADILISQLGRLENVRITPTSSIVRYAEVEDFDVFEVGKKLDVDSVLTASTQCDGEIVRVSYQLYNVRDKQILLSEKFDEKHEDIFLLQDRISRQIFQRLSQEITGIREPDPAAQYTKSIEAFQAYSKGLFYWNKQSAEGREESVKHFLEAIELDEKFALAYAYLADTYALGYFYEEKIGPLAGVQLAARAEENIRKAFELSPNCAEAMTALSLIHYRQGKKEEARDLLQKALTLKPNNATIQQRIAFLFPGSEKSRSGSEKAGNFYADYSVN